MTALKARPSRHWTFPCPVCGRKVRVNKDGTIAAHYGLFSEPMYCDGARKPAIYGRAS